MNSIIMQTEEIFLFHFFMCICVRMKMETLENMIVIKSLYYDGLIYFRMNKHNLWLCRWYLALNSSSIYPVGSTYLVGTTQVGYI